MRLAIPVLALLVLAAGRADAGLFCDNDEAIKQLETFAKDKTKADELDQQYTWVCLEGADAKYKERIEKACLKIVERDGDKSTCVRISAAAGLTKLGDRDLVALVAAFPEDPIEFAGGVGFYKVGLLARMGDPRGAKIVTDMWTAAIPRADAREKRHGGMADWSSWRQNAAKALGTLGDANDQAFLEEQAKATRDTHVAQKCRDGAAAIAKRLAAAPH